MYQICFSLQHMEPARFWCLEDANTSTWALVLQNSSVLSIIPTKGWERFTEKCFLAGASLHVPDSHFSVSQRRDHLPFIHVRVYWNPTFLCPTGSQGPVFKPGWLIEETTLRKPQQQTKERATVRDILGFSGLLLSWCLPVRWLDVPGSCSAALILIFYIFSRGNDARAVTCVQQTCMSIESFWRSLGFFIPRKWQTWNIHFLCLYLEVRKLPYPLQRKVLVCLYSL